MSTRARATEIDQAAADARVWINEVARQFDTADLEFAYGVLRGWLHTLRDQLTVEAAAHFAAQLPDPIRGIYYAGWQPRRVPLRFDIKTYSVRLACAAGIAIQDVPKASAAVTAALLRLLPPAHVYKILGQLPQPTRAMMLNHHARCSPRP